MVSAENGRKVCERRSHTYNAAAMTTFTAGPASDTHTSCRGSSGMRSSRDTPPMERIPDDPRQERSEEHTSELQSLAYLVCRLLLEKKKKHNNNTIIKT